MSAQKKCFIILKKHEVVKKKNSDLFGTIETGIPISFKGASLILPFICSQDLNLCE